MNIKLSFLGAAQNVTGSRFLLEAMGKKVLIDCGLYQERQLLDRNWDPFPVNPSQIDAMLLTHAHLDHCGLIPKLVREGFKGPVHCTTATAEITRIVMLDAASLQEEDAAYKRKRHKRANYTPPRPVEPLYTVEDAENSLNIFEVTGYDKEVKVAEGITACFHDAGHILGSAMIKVVVSNGNKSRSIIFSGDVGRCDRPMLNDPYNFSEADYVLMESTYGDRIHQAYPDIKSDLSEVVNQTRNAGGNIIVPSFAIERAQDVLYYLNELLIEDKIPDIMAFLDSPMAIGVTEVFKKHPEMMDAEMREHLNNGMSPFDFPGLTMTRTTKQSKSINQINGTVLIIAGSGMCTGGRVKHHLVSNIHKEESTILFVGYQAVGTLGRQIVEGNKKVRILGQEHSVKANITRIHGFSGHADQDQLARWIMTLKNAPEKVFIIHGETESAKIFRNHLEERTGWNVELPEYQQTVVLD